MGLVTVPSWLRWSMLWNENVSNINEENYVVNQENVTISPIGEMDFRMRLLLTMFTSICHGAHSPQEFPRFGQRPH